MRVTLPRPEALPARSGPASRLGREAGPYLFVAPILLLALIFYIVPIARSLDLSLHRWIIISGRDPEWVGLENYRQLLSDRRFLISFRNTWVFSLGVVPLGVSISLLLAVLLDLDIRARAFFRAAVFLPVIMPMVVVAMVWGFLFSAYGGVFNQMLGWLGYAPVRWLSMPDTAMNAIIVTSLWKTVGFNMIVFLAALQGIPQEYHEAAAIDGAGPWRRFRFVTLPLLRPAILFALVIATIGSFQVFTQVFVMTQGGPAFSTSTLVYYIYHSAFENFRMGYASAVAIVLFALLLVLTAAQLWLLRSRRS